MSRSLKMGPTHRTQRIINIPMEIAVIEIAANAWTVFCVGENGFTDTSPIYKSRSRAETTGNIKAHHYKQLGYIPTLEISSLEEILNSDEPLPQVFALDASN